MDKDTSEETCTGESEEDGFKPDINYRKDQQIVQNNYFIQTMRLCTLAIGIQITHFILHLI